MKRATAFTAIAGLFLAGVGMVALILQGTMTTLVKAHFLAALIGIALYIVTHAGTAIKTLRSRSTRYGALASVYVLVVVAIIIAVNAIGAITSAQVADLTESSLYTLAPQARKVVDNLQGDLVVHAFFNGGRNGFEDVRPIYRLIRTFVSSSPKIKLDIVDPVLDPLKAEKYNVGTNATIVLEYKDRTQKVNTVTEENITNAIIRLLDDRSKVACFTTGHGEPGISDQSAGQLQGMGALKDILQHKDYTVRDLDLRGQTQVPDDCSVVLVAGPRAPLNDGELILLDQFLSLGGRVFFGVDAGIQSNLEPLLNRWGVKLNNDVIIEKVVEGTMSRGAGFQPTTTTASMALTVSDYNQAYPITQDLSHIRQTEFFASRSLEPMQTATSELKIVPLMYTKKDSWAESDTVSFLRDGAARLDPATGDKPGPVLLAVAVSMEVPQGYSRQARMVVVGDSQWMTNRLMRDTQNFNSDLMLNMVGWLAGFEQYLAIGARSSEARSLSLRVDQKRAIFNITVIFIPELLLLLGAFVWWIRR